MGRWGAGYKGSLIFYGAGEARKKDSNESLKSVVPPNLWRKYEGFEDFNPFNGGVVLSLLASERFCKMLPLFFCDSSMSPSTSSSSPSPFSSQQFQNTCELLKMLRLCGVNLQGFTLTNAGRAAGKISSLLSLFSYFNLIYNDHSPPPS